MSESDKATAGGLCAGAGCDCGGTGAIARAYTVAKYTLGGDAVLEECVEYEECERHAAFVAALAEAREEGRREERRACWGIAKVFVARHERREASEEEMISFTGSVCAATCLDLAKAIAARGPMGEP